MHKFLVKIMLMLANVLFISGFAGNITTFLPVSALPPTDMSVALPTCDNCHSIKAADFTFTGLDNQVQNLSSGDIMLDLFRQAHAPENTLCVDCHGSVAEANPGLKSGNSVQFSRNQLFSAKLVDCEVCHIDKLETAIWHFRGED